MRLCSGVHGGLVMFDGRLLHLVAHVDTSPEFAAALRRAFPRPPDGRVVSARAILTGAAVHIPDLDSDPDFELTGLLAATGFRSALAVPLLRDGQAIGAIVVFGAEARPFSERQVELLRTFADQAVIAIENARVFQELEARNSALIEALEQQTATGEVLRVISSSPTDVQPVFDAVAESAARLCEAADVVIFRRDGDWLRLAAHFGPIPVGRVGEFVIPVHGTLGGRSVLEARTLQVADIQAEMQHYPEGAERGKSLGFRATLCVPLMRGGEAIGGIHLRRVEAQLFSERQIALLQTFAAQAVIAIENVRLFTELAARNRDLTETLDQQTATGEILRVISSSPTDVQPVFDAIASSSLVLCSATVSAVLRFDGKLVHIAALGNVDPDGASALRKAFPMPPSHRSASARAILTRELVHTPDVFDDPEHRVAAHVDAAGFRSVLSVPMLRESQAIGAITVGRPAPGNFSDRQIAVLQTFADQAVIAIENVRLFRELETKNRDLSETLEQQTATSEILRVISSSPTDVRPVFETIARNARALCAAASGTVMTYDGQ